jgi:hypothetical protein
MMPFFPQKRLDFSSLAHVRARSCEFLNKICGRTIAQMRPLDVVMPKWRVARARRRIRFDV